MLIFYFTTSLETNDFNHLQDKWKISLNTSNQCFHNKMIRSLAANNEVHVISLRPYNKNFVRDYSLNEFETKIGNITYHYLKISTSRFDLFSYKKEAEKIINNYKNSHSIIITDTMNLKCLMIAKKLAKSNKLPLIGVCTDLPSNITGVNKLYIKLIKRNSSKLNGYIVLTEKLNLSFNANNKPHLIINGIVENRKELPNIKNNYGNYFFYGGTLLKKFGVYDLINAFKEINNPSLNLVLCGHHSNEKELKAAIGDCKNIYYIGLQPVDKVIELEQNAYANINPRPLDNALDELSIPSKTLEYLNSGKLTISYKNILLKDLFKNEIIWADNNDTLGLISAIKKVLELDQEHKLKIETLALKKCQKLYSINSISKKLNGFLTEFFK